MVSCVDQPKIVKKQFKVLCHPPAQETTSEPAEDINCKETNISTEMGHPGPNIRQYVIDMILNFIRWQRPKQLEQLGSNATTAIQDERV
jgi:hypothetical protein